MESLSVLDIYKKIKERGLIFLDYAVLSKLTGYSNKNTLYKISQKLENKKVLEKDLFKFLPFDQRTIVKNLPEIVADKLKRAG